MRLNKILALLLLVAIFCSCEKSNRDFPAVRKLSTFQNTDFIPTLEHKIRSDKNFIYCSSFLFAWDEIRNSIKKPLLVDSTDNDLYLVNRAKSFVGTLRKDEYSSKVKVEVDIITARVEFKKSLPFEFPLNSYDHELVFAGEKVASFGMRGTDYTMMRTVHIMYYENDCNFIIKLLPKENEHEIILAMTTTAFTSLSDIVHDVNSKMKIDTKEYHGAFPNLEFNGEDELVIPKLRFNIETNYSTLEGKRLSSSGVNYMIDKASQRTAFLLNEKGAEIESVTDVIFSKADSTLVPKKMRFDKPFFVMLKRVDSKYPYFGAWIANTELMIKE